MQIPISLKGIKDRFYWNRSILEDYTVQSGYRAAKEEVDRNQSTKRGRGEPRFLYEEAKGWNELWKPNTKHKIKHFMWKRLHQVLPSKEIIYKRIGKGDQENKMCNGRKATIEYILFFFCKKAVEVWKLSPWPRQKAIGEWDDFDLSNRKDREENINEIDEQDNIQAIWGLLEGLKTSPDQEIVEAIRLKPTTKVAIEMMRKGCCKHREAATMLEDVVTFLS
ncbi:hypothetical protein ACH5RR_019380 [Cinchona calisaya]|uniref:Reverse transcriptase zinc-binding domain-containing protein n=1 Tax=Cinchona calisaya TaxID=153742 RepID=A0ABD2ZQX7_9GENT